MRMEEEEEILEYWICSRVRGLQLNHFLCVYRFLLSSFFFSLDEWRYWWWEKDENWKRECTEWESIEFNEREREQCVLIRWCSSPEMAGYYCQEENQARESLPLSLSPFHSFFPAFSLSLSVLSLGSSVLFCIVRSLRSLPFSPVRRGMTEWLAASLSLSLSLLQRVFLEKESIREREREIKKKRGREGNEWDTRKTTWESLLQELSVWKYIWTEREEREREKWREKERGRKKERGECFTNFTEGKEKKWESGREKECKNRACVLELDTIEPTHILSHALWSFLLFLSPSRKREREWETEWDRERERERE